MTEIENSTTEQSLSLDQRLQENHIFRFRPTVDRRKFLRRGLLFVFSSMFIGASIGIILTLALDASGITHEYGMLLVGAGIGSGFGVIFGLLLFFALKANIINDFGASFGAGVDINIFIGGFIGAVFGCVTGSIFGIILSAIDYPIVTTITYPVTFGMLVWIVLGLNTGVLVGVISSLGIIDITLSGIISGAFFGTIGIITMFGPDIVTLLGLAAGIIVGGFIGFFVKYSINANMGTTDSLACAVGSSVVSTSPRRIFKKNQTACGGRYVYNFSSLGCGTRNLCGSGARPMGGGTMNTCYQCSYGNCGACANCGFTGGECGGLGVIGLVLSIPIIILIGLISWVSAQASIRFGKLIKPGAMTAIASSTSIMLLIGSNIGLTRSFHDLKIYNIGILGATLGLAFSLIIFLTIFVSIKWSLLEVSPMLITWKDKYSVGSEIFNNIEEIHFIRGDELVDTVYDKEEDYVKFVFKDGRSANVLLDCWEIPDQELSSFEYIQKIIVHYLEQTQTLGNTTEEVVGITEDKIEIHDQSGTHSVTYKTEITETMVRRVESSLGNARRINIHWVSTVTQIPQPIVEQIVVENLGLKVEKEKIINKEKRNEKFK